MGIRRERDRERRGREARRRSGRDCGLFRGWFVSRPEIMIVEVAVFINSGIWKVLRGNKGGRGKKGVRGKGRARRWGRRIHWRESPLCALIWDCSRVIKTRNIKRIIRVSIVIVIMNISRRGEEREEGRGRGVERLVFVVKTRKREIVVMVLHGASKDSVRLKTNTKVFKDQRRWAAWGGDFVEANQWNDTAVRPVPPFFSVLTPIDDWILRRPGTRSNYLVFIILLTEIYCELSFNGESSDSVRLRPAGQLPVPLPKQSKLTVQVIMWTVSSV